MGNQGNVNQFLVELVKQETKPAIGCTEPVAVAFAAATAKKYFNEEIESIDVKVSLNIFKNGKSVTIPSTNECGLDLAAAVGAVAGDPENGYFVFKNIDEKSVNTAKALLKKGIVTVTVAKKSEDIYVEIDMRGISEHVHVILKDNHTNIFQIDVNEKTTFKNVPTENSSLSYEILKDLDFKSLRKAAEEVEFKKIEFLLDGVKMNKFAAEQGLKQDTGINFGSALSKLMDEGKFSSDAYLRTKILTAAGADFRMSGGNCPVMTSGGSGNQGIGIILPIAVISEDINASDEKLSRALFLGHAINLYVKAYTGKLAAICGCSIASGIGASAAIAWLLGGTDKQISGAIENMLANLTGMICDGAKGSCALKLSTSAGEAVVSAYLACRDVVVPEKTGIIGTSAEDTIKNIGILCKKAFANADSVLVDDILCNY